MAEVVKTEPEGHAVDIVAMEGKPNLTYDPSEEIKASVTAALFFEKDIGKYKFEDPTFDGIHLRLICNNDVSKDWLLATIPKLEGISQGLAFEAVVVGTPPKFLRASVKVPAKAFETPPALFTVIGAQNGIETKFWKYLSRTKIENGHQIWFIGIDENSISSLKAIGFRPYVGITCFKFSVTNTPANY